MREDLEFEWGRRIPVEEGAKEVRVDRGNQERRDEEIVLENEGSGFVMSKSHKREGSHFRVEKED